MSNIIKKKAKAKIRRKDFVKKKNILANIPTIIRIYKKPLYKQETSRKGIKTFVQIGFKDKVIKLKIKPSVSFKKSKKYITKKKNESKKNGGASAKRVSKK